MISNNGVVDGAVSMTAPFGLAIALGLVPGYDTIDKFGVNLEITTDTDPEDCWEFGGLYPYDADGTAPIAYVSSSSTADVGQTILVYGNDIEGNRVVQSVVTDGQSNVELETPLWRVWRMVNNSATDGEDRESDPANIQGILYCHTDAAPTLGVPADANVRAIINGSNNQTLMAQYTIPRGYVGVLFKGELGAELEGNVTSLAEYARCHYISRRYGKVASTKKAVTLIIGGGSSYVDVRAFPDIIPAMSDISMQVQEVTDTLGVWSALDILLIREDKIPRSRLVEIGQPGY